MPYINKVQRGMWDEFIEQIEAEHNNSHIEMGEINYFVSRLLWRQFHQNKSYKKANEIVGVLECIKAEFYRRVVAPYEDVKIQENGDVNLL